MLNQKGFSPFLIIFVVFLIIISLGSIYYVKSFINPPLVKEQSVPQRTTTIVSSSSPIPAVDPYIAPDQQKIFTNPSEVLKETAFIKKSTRLNAKFFGKEDFPTEIKTLTDAQLINFKCTNFFYDDGKGAIYYTNGKTTDDPDYKYYKFSDEPFINLIKNEQIVVGRAISSVAQCLTENNKQYLLFSTQPTGQAGSGTIFYTVSLGNNYSVLTRTKINDPNILGSTYPGCSVPLAFTSENMYLECGGGDGGSGYQSIFKLNLSTQKISVLKYCSSRLDINEGGEQIESLVCK